MDRIEAMKVFSVVASKGSFTAAADTLHISKAKVTRYICELEEWLGCRLIQRSTRSMSLTPAGEESLVKINAIIESSNSLLDSINNSKEIPQGTLRISTNTALGETILSKVITQYIQKYPNVKIDLVIDDKCLNLIDHRIDIAIRASNELDNSLIARPLANEKTVVCASPYYLEKHPIIEHPSVLSNHKTLLCTSFKPYDKWLFQKAGESVEVNLNGAFHSNDMRVLAKATIEGGGIARLPSFLVSKLINQNKLIPLLENWNTFEITLCAVYLCRVHQPITVRTFIDFTVDFFEQAKSDENEILNIKTN